MKKPEITKGTWSWQKRGKRGTVCMLNAYHPPGFAKNVLEIYGHVEPTNPNAQAIAALPDLLEALEGALDRINAANDHQRAAGRLEYATHDIVAALTKAGYTF